MNLLQKSTTELHLENAFKFHADGGFKCAQTVAENMIVFCVMKVLVDSDIDYYWQTER
ncbi:MAG: hypothetical protein LBF12_00325 [Christensenellaceae bacterium]|jgi:hypothetical protein|nr:hypothetical protein [Christensenellaceae bacterium]